MLLSTIATLLLPVALLAAPAPITRITPAKLAIREAAAIGLRTAKIECEIVSSDGAVNCRSGPGTGYTVVAQLDPGTWDEYICWARGTDIGGNETWDWNSDYGCYVSGYYTDDNCSTSTLDYC